MLNNMSPQRVRYHYEIDPDARLELAHGVWGGVTPNGELELFFYHQSDSLPEFTEQVILPDGSTGDEEIPSESNLRHITRHIHSRLIMDYPTALSLAEWLNNRVSELEAAHEQQDIYTNGNGLKQ